MSRIVRLVIYYASAAIAFDAISRASAAHHQPTAVLQPAAALQLHAGEGAVLFSGLVTGLTYAVASTVRPYLRMRTCLGIECVNTVRPLISDLQRFSAAFAAGAVACAWAVGHERTIAEWFCGPALAAAPHTPPRRREHRAVVRRRRSAARLPYMNFEGVVDEHVFNAICQE